MNHKPQGPPPVPGRGRPDRSQPGGSRPGDGPQDNGAGDTEQAAPPGFEDALPLLIIGAILATIAALVTAARQWLAPWVPLVATVGVGLALTAAIGLLYCERDQKRTLKLGAAICTVIALPTALWLVGPLRAAVIDYFGDHLPNATHQAALSDPSDAVQLGACEAVAEGSDRLLKEHLLDLLTAKPSLAARCLESSDDDGLGKAALVHRYVRRFDLAVQEENVRQVCQAAPYLFSMERSQGFRPTRQLTLCAVHSQTPAMARCCADALTEKFDEAGAFVSALGEPSSVERKQRRPLFLGMVPHAFRGIDASRAELPRLERRLLRDASSKRWLLALGCGSLFEFNRADDIVGGLEAVVDSFGCSMRERGERKRDSWAQICGDLARVEEPTDQLCEAVRNEAVGAAVLAARAQLHSAIDAFYSSEASRDIIRADERMRRFANSPQAAAADLAEAMRPERDTNRVTDGNTRRLMRRISGNFDRATAMHREHFGADPGAEPSADDVKAARKLLENMGGANSDMTADEVIKNIKDPAVRRELSRKLDRNRKRIKRNQKR